MNDPGLLAMWLNGINDEYPVPVTMRRDKDFLRSLDQSVSLHYADKDFDLTELSTELSLSKRQVQRRLKALAGCTPSGYIRSYRLQQSLRLLKKGLPVMRVAKAVGFSSQAYYASCFKAEFDQTPTDYQRRRI